MLDLASLTCSVLSAIVVHSEMDGVLWSRGGAACRTAALRVCCRRRSRPWNDDVPRSSLRAYSSKGDDKNGDKPIGRPVGATPVLQPRSGPIRINETPRAAAGSKLRSVNNHGWNEDSSKHYPPGSRHPAHALIYGDTPQDPHPTPFQLAHYGEESLYTLILLRHGESEWNNENRYTGWCDVSLTDKGKLEARAAGRLLYENGIEIDHAFTSVLKRASFSCNMALNTAQQHWVPITKTWRLNERHYGALQGYNKDTAYEELNLDQELVMQMRRAYDVQPPRMGDDHPFWHGNDRRYRKLTAEQLERSRAESLKDTAERIMPFWKSVIVPSIRAGNKCLIVSHANTIRTLVKHIDQISDEDIKGMTIPTGIPLLYRLDKDLRPVDPQIEMEFRYLVEPKGYVPLSCGYFPCRLQVVLTLGPCGLLPILLFFCQNRYTWGTSRAHGFHGVYLGDLERLQDIQSKRDKSNRDWQRIILRNIGKSLGWDMDSDADNLTTGPEGSLVVETRQVWWHVHTKMENPDYRNMLLLAKMEDWLEEIMFQRGQKFLTKSAYEKMVRWLRKKSRG